MRRGCAPDSGFGIGHGPAAAQSTAASTKVPSNANPFFNLSRRKAPEGPTVGSPHSERASGSGSTEVSTTGEPRAARRPSPSPGPVIRHSGGRGIGSRPCLLGVDRRGPVGRRNCSALSGPRSQAYQTGRRQHSLAGRVREPSPFPVGSHSREPLRFPGGSCFRRRAGGGCGLGSFSPGRTAAPSRPSTTQRVVGSLGIEATPWSIRC